MKWYEFFQFAAIFLAMGGGWIIVGIAEWYMKKSKIGFYEPFDYSKGKVNPDNTNNVS